MFNGTQFVGDYSLVNNTWNLFSVETLDSFDSIYGISLDSDELMDVNVVGDSFVYSYVSGNLNPGQLYWAKIGDARFGPELQSTGIIGWILEGLSYLFNS